eukprot:TRINITY_DN4662_c0_g1_i3.p1 TRINITY_DN4662_c0_g1~~TRINITY_DN4662_c0_g1_i3.p1  ORF type:complete len:130 (-),score=1.35 TRINITY_DN4662_c0_g1_i3:90-479(-)
MQEQNLRARQSSGQVHGVSDQLPAVASSPGWTTMNPPSTSYCATAKQPQSLLVALVSRYRCFVEGDLLKVRDQGSVHPRGTDATYGFELFPAATNETWRKINLESRFLHKHRIPVLSTMGHCRISNQSD